MKPVLVLVTLDVHPVPNIGAYVVAALEGMRLLGIRATLFFTTTVLEAHRDLALRAIDEGHQIGAHGLLHNAGAAGPIPPERYDALSECDQRLFLTQSTERNYQALGRDIGVFRAPSFGISGATVRVLEELGYRADLSVNSQRLDLLMSKPFVSNHFLAPRLPYHPSHGSPFRRGNASLLEIPLSAAVFPFAVMTLMGLGLLPMKFLYRLLRAESRLTGKPIVYMGHPEEFSDHAASYAFPSNGLSWRDFLPRPHEGIRARKVLLLRDPRRLNRDSLELFEYMAKFEDVSFVTVEDYLALRSATSSKRGRLRVL